MRFRKVLLDEHRMNKGDFERENIVISHLLSLRESQPEYYTDEIIKAIMIVSLFLLLLLLLFRVNHTHLVPNLCFGFILIYNF